MAETTRLMTDQLLEAVAFAPRDADSTDAEVRVIVFRDGDLWVAQCLEADIGAQAPDFDTLCRYFQAVFEAELNEGLARTGEPFGEIGKAPACSFEKWDFGRRPA